MLTLFKLHWKTDDSSKQTATKGSMDWANEKLAKHNENEIVNKNIYNWRKQRELKRFKRETHHDATERFKMKVKIFEYCYKPLGNMYLSEQ